MALILMKDVKKGIRLEIDSNPYKIIDFQHVKPGKGPAFVRMKLKNLSSNKVIEKTMHAGDKFNIPDLEKKTMQYLYDDGENLQFMDVETFEQLSLTYEQVGNNINYMMDGMETNILFYNKVAISVEIPQIITLKVIDTPPNHRGDSQSSNKKPAKLETGAVIQVPFFVLIDDLVKVDTVEGKYLEKVINKK